MNIEFIILWLIIGLISLVGMIGFGISEYYTHTEKLYCIKQVQINDFCKELVKK